MSAVFIPSFRQQAYQRATTLFAGRGLRRFPLVNHLHSFMKRRLRRREADVLGHRMLLDENDSLELSWNGIYEPYETSLVQQIAKPGGTIVDIGANIGYYTLIFARAVGGAG